MGVGDTEGEIEGLSLGLVLGEADGLLLGLVDGLALGLDDGEREGLLLGLTLGLEEGDTDGDVEGTWPSSCRRATPQVAEKVVPLIGNFLGSAFVLRQIHFVVII